MSNRSAPARENCLSGTGARNVRWMPCRKPASLPPGQSHDKRSPTLDEASQGPSRSSRLFGGPISVTGRHRSSDEN